MAGASTIRTVTFLVHPYCYAPSRGVPEGWQASRWQRYRDRERVAEPHWLQVIDAAAPDELVVYHPCFESAEERSLAAHGEETLGHRWLRLAARAALYTPDAMAALAPGIEASFGARGKYEWCVHDLRIAAFSWHYAQDLRAHLHDHGLALDGVDLRLRAVGESFEGCVTTWSTMVPAYLPTAARVEIPYAATVPDTEFLLGCEHLGRHELPHDTALHLFIDAAGRPVAHFKRERVELADTHRWARVPWAAQELCILDALGQSVPIGDTPGTPASQPGAAATDGVARVDGDAVRVMVTTGRRYRAPGTGVAPEAPLFVIGDAADVHGFCDAARQARIAPTPGEAAA